MSDPKKRVIDSIENARSQLKFALSELHRLPIFDPKRVAFASHALHNYITVTDGTVDLLEEALRTHPNPEIRSWLEGLQHTNKLMDYTVSQLFNASIHGMPDYIFGIHYLPILIERVCNYYQKLSVSRKINIEYRSIVEDSQAWTDQVALASVLDNLLSNAVKYSDDGGIVNVNLSEVGEKFVCSITDHGKGMSEEEQEKLFDTDIDFSNLQIEEKLSNGFGLIVAKELIENLGGEIRCESELGEGTTFSITIPKYDEKLHKF